MHEEKGGREKQIWSHNNQGRRLDAASVKENAGHRQVLKEQNRERIGGSSLRQRETFLYEMEVWRRETECLSERTSGDYFLRRWGNKRLQRKQKTQEFSRDLDAGFVTVSRLLRKLQGVRQCCWGPQWPGGRRPVWRRSIECSGKTECSLHNETWQGKEKGDWPSEGGSDGEEERQGKEKWATWKGLSGCSLFTEISLAKPQ